MLQQILDDMFIDPDVLDALNDDQKKILFLKMRQEQVRRWTEREEKLESEAVDGERKRTAPKKANRKNVSWLPGRDGDVAVIVIGERDELNSKFIHSGFGEKSLQNNACHQTILKSRTTAPVAAERENTQPGISLNLKKTKKPNNISHAELLCYVEPNFPWRQKSSLTTLDGEASASNTTGRSCDGSTPLCSLKCVEMMDQLSGRSAFLSSPLSSPSEGRTHIPAPLPDSSPGRRSARADNDSIFVSVRVFADVAASEAPRRAVPGGGGWSAQLMKTFSTESPGGPAQTPSPPRGVKPPLPNKPGHLRLKTTPTVR
uniref:Zgc:100829 n=1 Tax=Gasterosteus aculeatus TaxID=69293 RepID=G3QBQ3_GASAC